jgi:hypothetical protein
MLMNLKGSWRGNLVWVVKVNLAFLLINTSVLLLLGRLSWLDFAFVALASHFSMMLLLEAGILFLTGGLVALSSSIFASKVREHVFHSDEAWTPEEHAKSGKKANVILFEGLILFLESLALSILIL